MQQTEILELFGPILKQGTQRRRITDYAAVVLLVLVAVLWGYSAWRNGQLPKIESISLVPNSVVVIGPAESNASGAPLAFCPGQTMTVKFQIATEGAGAIYADDVAHRGNHTVKFSDVWRDVVESGTRTYEDEWVIPHRPDMAIDGQREWMPGLYERTISVAASNIYISRYVPPATFPVAFRIAENCK